MGIKRLMDAEQKSAVEQRKRWASNQTNSFKSRGQLHGQHTAAKQHILVMCGLSSLWQHEWLMCPSNCKREQGEVKSSQSFSQELQLWKSRGMLK